MPRPALDLDRLTADEKLRLLEEIWDSLASDPERVPVPDSQRREIERRVADDDGARPRLDWNEVLDRLRRGSP